MIKNYIFFIAFVFAFYFGNAQMLRKQTLASQGSSHVVYTNNKSYYIIESIGQASIINTYEANNYSLRQGYLQPVSASIVVNGFNADFKAVIFPNPFSSEVQIKFKEPVIDILQVTVRDVLGRIVLNQRYNPMQSIVLNLDHLNIGSYSVHVSMRSKLLKSKIIKR
ncbi:T9SS type A sorting domain-containing protein [Flavivirga rizhaonensis]|uniref:T9SS type A sorting domain-containing protein n=1 Tax=Flavivirga rizhaonensis TaxID=2559571 RepID=A0A4S1E421_9FLAO|nr:T9SS type A sorting domain-containing protein [Flavivirga rizhaonensis]TGV04742.1 T9SS type A sorting domain-containing protein [Flavivirga rizhaonensis]